MVKYKDVLSRTFAALADPTRRYVLERLRRGPAAVSELAEPHGLSLPGMLKHVRLLEQAGLLRTTKDGRVRRCGLSPRPLRDASRYLDRYRALWESRFDALAEYLERMKERES